MKLMTWNVGLAGKFFRKVMCIFEPTHISIQNICARIKKENADIVALQEVYHNDFQTISLKLENMYPYKIHEPDLGLCFFSKPEITHEYKVIFPRDMLSNCLRSKNGLLIVREKNTNNFFCNVHLSCGLGCEYEYEYLNLVRKVHVNNRLILLGDFNAYRNHNFKKIADKLYINVNKENTYKSYRHPLLNCNFDYIVDFKEKNKYGDEMKCDCISDYTSDHYPIITFI